MPFCSQCGIDNPPSARFCDQCGTVLVSIAPTNPAISSKPATPPAPVAPAAPINPAPVPQTIQSAPISANVVCAQCGIPAIPGEAFCDNCGAPLGAPTSNNAAPAPAPYAGGIPAQPSYPAPQAVSYTPPPVAPAPAPAPAPAAAPISSAPQYSSLSSAHLVLTSTKSRIDLPNTTQALIGRADPVSNFTPDIDLNAFGALQSGVGRRHARIFVQQGQFFIEDQDSTNGTLVNGQKLAPYKAQIVQSGDLVQFGTMVLRFQL